MDRSKSIREETVEKRLKRLCDERGWLCLKLDPSTKKGIPDRMIVASYGLLYFVELKRPKGGRLEPIQKHWQKDLKERGQDVCVANTRESVDALVARIEAEVEGNAELAKLGLNVPGGARR